MAWLLFTAGVVFGVLTLHSFRPLRWPGSFVLGAWISSWLVIELPLHLLAAQVTTAALVTAAGGIEHWPGFVGLGLTALSGVGLVRHFSVARRTHEHVEGALVQTLGADYRADIVPKLRRKFKDAMPWFRLARVFPIRRGDVERISNLRYADEDNRRLELDIYRHRGRPTGSPILLYTHGGGWVIGNKAQQGLVTVNHMASRGWLCVSINYRLSPRATFPDHLLDLKRAIKWVRENAEQYGGDPSFIVLAGGSAGAHLSALAALTPNAAEYQRDFPDVDTTVQGCVAYYGVYDFTDRYGHWPHNMFRMMLEKAIMKRRLADAPEEYAKASPIDRLGNHAPPFLMFHGTRDNLAPVGDARKFAEAFRERTGAPVAYVELPGAQHAFELFPSVRSLQVINGVERFCAAAYSKHLVSSDEQAQT